MGFVVVRSIARGHTQREMAIGQLVHAHYSQSNLCLCPLATHCIRWPYSLTLFLLSSAVCTNATAPSVSSINRILRNRAAERAAAEFARAASYGYALHPTHPHPHPYTSFPTWPSSLPGAHHALWSAVPMPGGSGALPGSGFGSEGHAVLNNSNNNNGGSLSSGRLSLPAMSPESGSRDSRSPDVDANRMIGELQSCHKKKAHKLTFLQHFLQTSRARTATRRTVISRSSVAIAQPSVRTSWMSWRRSSRSRTIRA